MRETCPNKCRYAFPWTYPLILIAILMLGVLVSGCFVLTGDRRYKPQAPRQLVELNTKSEIKYWRLLDSPDLNLDIGVENGLARWGFAQQTLHRGDRFRKPAGNDHCLLYAGRLDGR